MRLIGMLAFVVLWLAFGFVPPPASAEPCPFHTHEAAAVEHRAHGMVAPVAPGGPEQALAVVAPDLLAGQTHEIRAINAQGVVSREK
jgi:hypothetical protein